MFSLSHWSRAIFGGIRDILNVSLFQMLHFLDLFENMSGNQVLNMRAETKASIVCPSPGLVLKGEGSDEI